MAQRVIDVLEIVEIDVDKREFVPTTARILNVAAEPVAEQRTIGQGGQRIVSGEIGKAGLRSQADRHLFAQSGVRGLDLSLRLPRLFCLALRLLSRRDEGGFGHVLLDEGAEAQTVTSQGRVISSNSSPGRLHHASLVPIS